MKNKLFSLVALLATLSMLTLVSCKDETKAKSIMLSKASLTLQVGGSEKLQATVDPSDWKGSIKWSSADEAIAKVDANGNVTAIAVGTTTIKAQADNATATCTLTIKAENAPMAKSITLSKASLTLQVGGSEKLQATVDPSDWKGTIKWSSADEAIAKVDANGNVTAIAVGTTTIKAQADNATATCTLTVNEKQPTTGIPGGDQGKALDLTLEMLKEYIWDYTESASTIVYKGDKPMVIDLWAAWCGPCKIAAPVIEQLAADFKGKAYAVKAKIAPDNAQSMNTLGTTIYKGAKPIGFAGSIPFFILLAPGKPAQGLSYGGPADLKTKVTAFFHANGAQ